MRADDIPVKITRLTYTAPGPIMSQNEVAEVLAHYWTAIEQNIRADGRAKAFHEAADHLDTWVDGRQYAHSHLPDFVHQHVTPELRRMADGGT